MTKPSTRTFISKYKLFFYFTLLISVFTYREMQGQVSWVQKAGFGAGVRYGASSFTIGAKGYTGTGVINSTTLTNDFWEFDPATNVWTQKANFGGGIRTSAMAFAIGTKGYIGLGTSNIGATIFPKDLWEYDPATNTWVQRANFPGAGRYTVASFSIGTKGYMGTGWSGPRYGDFWEYDQVTNAWTQKANFGGAARQSATGFALNGNGYIGAGYSTTSLSDFWEYNPASNTWVQKAFFPGTARYAPVSMAVGGNAYVGGGTNISLVFNDFYKYDPLLNTWTSIPNYPGLGRVGMASMSGISSGFTGTGSSTANYLGTLNSDFWEFRVTIPASITSGGSNILCPGGSVILTANSGTGLTYQWKLNGINIPGAIAISYTATVGGNYSCVVSDGALSNESNAIAISEGVAVITSAGATFICPGGYLTLNANSGTGNTYQWKLGGTDIAGATASSYTAIQPGDYSCMVTTACGSLLSNVISVTLGSAPQSSITAGGPTTFCASGSVTLSANTGIGLTYQWKNNGTSISGATTSTYLATTAGDYVCVVTNNCGSVTSNTITVSHSPLPSASITASGPVTFCNSGSVTLSANTGAGLTYQWYRGNSPISGEVSSSYLASSYGDYRCVVYNACGGTASNSILVSYVTGTLYTILPMGPLSYCNGTNPNSLTIYPIINPGDPNLAIQWSKFGGSGFMDILGANGPVYSPTQTGTYACRITSVCGAQDAIYQATGAWYINITILEPPVITLQPENRTACPGGNISFNVTATGAGLTYQWQENGTNIVNGGVYSGVNTNTLTLTGVTSNFDLRQYRCIVSGTCTPPATSWSSTLWVSVLNTPSITITGPSVFCGGTSVTYQAVLQNAGMSPQIRWKKNGVVVASNVTSWSNSYLSNGDVITCTIITNDCAFTSATSNSIVVTVNTPVAVISAAGATTLCPGGSVMLNANAGAGLSYQWKLNGTDIAGATASSYIATTAGNFTCTVTGNGCSNTSNSIVVVMLLGGNNAVLIRPDAASGTDAVLVSSAGLEGTNFGSSAEINALAWDVSPVAFQRSLIRFDLSAIPTDAAVQSAEITLYNDANSSNGSPPGSHFGANSSWLQKVTSPWTENAVTWNSQPTTTAIGQASLSASSNPHQNYVVNVTAFVQEMIANPATNYGFMLRLQTEAANKVLVFASSDNFDPAIRPSLSIVYTVPFSSIINAAGPTSFCSGGSVTLNANTGTGLAYQWNLNGSDIAGATSSAYIATAAGNYTCVVTGSCNGITSNSITVAIDLPAPATITAGGPTAFCSGNSVTLNANTGTGLTYQWKLGGANINGATASSYNATAAGNYTCVVSNSCGGNTSNSITVSISPLATAIISAAGPTAICTGGSVTLNANTGTGLTYQWKLNGTDITGATTNSYNATAAGSYTCVVSNTCGGTTSNSITVTIASLPAATITAAGSTAICQGSSVTLNANTGTGLTYQWKLGGSDINGATTSSYNATAAGSYTCVVSNICGSTTSNSLTVSINPLPTATITAAGSTAICQGSFVTLNANTGTGLTYQWKLSGTNITGATATSYNATAAGNYTCVVSNSCGGSSSNSIAVTINPLPTATITAGGPTAICTGGSVTLNSNTGTGLTYQWKQNGSNITGATASSYNATTTGSYTCAVTNACGTSNSNTITVTSGTAPATPSVITGSNKVCPLTTESYYVTPVAGMTYNWTLPANSSITTNYGNNIYVTFAANFNGGTLSVTASNGCGTSTPRTRSISKNNRCGAIVASITSLDRMLDAIVYPNPSPDHFTLRVLTKEPDACLMIVHDLTGRVVERRENIRPGESVEFGNKLSGGVYLIEVIQGKDRKVLRVVKSE